jgi:hypothetical protein
MKAARFLSKSSKIVPLMRISLEYPFRTEQVALVATLARIWLRVRSSTKRGGTELENKQIWAGHMDWPAC